MSDEFEARLRDYFRRAAEGIHPDSEMLERARAAGRRRVPAWRRRRSGFAAGAGLMAAAAMAAVFALPSGSPAERVPGPGARPAPDITIRPGDAAVPAGGEIRISGGATGPLDVSLLVAGLWRDVDDVTPVNGRYATTVTVPDRVDAVRVCLAGSTICSMSLRLDVLPEPPISPTPRPTPHPTVGPPTPSARPAHPTGMPTPVLRSTPTGRPAVPPPTPSTSTPAG